ncbi:PKD domain-containing protein [Shewanella corallii]|uniref:PKD domain-containing protein n=1 Tax=Shewanella corallii TaxID=560080 RepID=A0ABT0N2X3_9GAMM|nr:PKD domain-containing protein [Shewanella corallii]MCL2912786.1 PKD domain-containing protein [Shewanella corallii]
MRKRLVTQSIALLMMTTATSVLAAPPSLLIEMPSQARQAVSAGPSDPEIIQSQTYGVARSALGLGTASLTLALPTGGSISVERLKAFHSTSGALVWQGRVNNKGKSLSPGDNQIILVSRDGYLSGTVRVNGKLYKLMPQSADSVVMQLIDESLTPQDHSGDLPEPMSQMRSLPSFPVAQSVTTTTTSVIKVLVGYTTEAARQNPGILSLIDLAVAETNQGFTDSGVNAMVELAHVYELNYAETGNHGTDLDRFETPNDGYMDEVHGLRDQYGADVAAILIGDAGACGRAGAIGATVDTAFMVVKDSCATGYYSFGHELGHLMSARHNPEKDSKTTPYAFGHGFLYTSGGWRSIMSYNSNSCCTRQNFWSDPTRSFQGVTRGTTDTHDNARVLNLTASTIAAFKSDPSGGNQPPVADFSSSVNGMTVTFTDASSDADGSVDLYSWDFGDGNQSAQASPVHTYAATGSYNVSLTVTDDNGATNTRSARVSVSAAVNQPPVADFVVNTSGLTANFIDQSQDSDGSIVEWMWDFGDGAQSSSASPAHTYASVGTYQVSLTVTDDEGASHSQTKSVGVSNASQLSMDDFESDFGSWSNSASNTWDWSRRSGSTPSSSTGPQSGAAGSDYYLYVETSNNKGAYNAGDVVSLESPMFVAQEMRLAFDYHMYGANIGSLSVDIRDNGNWIEDIWQLSGEQHSSSDEFSSASVDFSGYSGELQLRLRVVAAGGWKGDIAVDNLQIYGTRSGNGNQLLAGLDFETGIDGGWSNSQAATDSWFEEPGTTPSNSTGPDSGAQTTGQYGYFETSSSYAYNAGDTAYLDSPVISGHSRTLSFFYHMYGANIGSLHVDVLNNGVWTEDLFVVSGQQHESEAADYTQANVDLSGFSGDIQVRFRAEAVGGWKGDIAIDDIRVEGQL